MGRRPRLPATCPVQLKRAYAYIRVSSPSSGKDETESPNVRAARIRDYAVTNDFHLLEIYDDTAAASSRKKSRRDGVAMLCRSS